MIWQREPYDAAERRATIRAMLAALRGPAKVKEPLPDYTALQNAAGQSMNQYAGYGTLQSIGGIFSQWAAGP